MCTYSRGEASAHLLQGTAPPSPHGGGFWREVGLLKSLRLSEFRLNAFSSAVHVFLLHLEKRPRSQREERAPGQSELWSPGASRIPALTLISCGPATILSGLLPSSLTTKEPPHRLLYGLHESCGKA